MLAPGNAYLYTAYLLKQPQHQPRPQLGIRQRQSFKKPADRKRPNTHKQRERKCQNIEKK
ncbi:hypothetical protein AA0481_1664 [Acetobacter orientalis NRIC 0481]|nr:hypothetical protein AA0481_1664 [Acetobacter orientalis NRIC 0481]